MERRLAAILCADVAGYSRLMGADEEGTLARLTAIRRDIVDQEIHKRGGRIVKTTGDGLLAEFASPVEAVRCALMVQEAVAARNTDAPGPGRLEFRIGVNLGDVIVADDDLHGEGVNVAARLQALAAPGGICISGTVHEHVRDKIPATFLDRGEQSLKNIIRTVRVFATTPIGGESGSTLPLSDKPAIAVMPFDNIGGDAATDRLADGITEDIITDLARFRGLDVIARNSTAVYKGRSVDVRVVGKDLNVHYVLEGSIQRQGEQIRCTAQLINPSTGATLWSARWDRPDKDIFAVQIEVAEQVAATLGGMGGSAAITAEEMRKARRRPPANLTAYDYYLLANQGRTLFTQESVLRGIDAATKALALDPTLGRAYVARAWLNFITVHHGADVEAAMQAMEADAKRAVELDPYDAEAHVALAFYLGGRGHFDECDAHIRAALQANPANPQVLVVAAAMRAWSGKPDEAAEMADKVMRLDPRMTAENLNCVKDAYFFARRFDDAIAAISRIPQDARGRGTRLLLTLSYALLGRQDETARARAELLANYPSISAELLMNQDWIFARPQEENLLLEGFRAAGLPVCASNADLAKIPNPRRLPECTTQTAAKLKVRSGAIGADSTPYGAAIPDPNDFYDGSREDRAVSGKPSIAVLPFVNLSSDPDQGFFSDGITEDIVTELSRFRQLSILSCSAAFQRRDKSVDVARIGRDLGVAYLVEGSVRRLGERIRITAQLVDTSSGKHLWAERFDRGQQEIFAVQDQIVRTIAGTLAGRLEAAGTDLAKRKQPASLAAYECVLRGKSIPLGDVQTEAEKRRMYEKAIEIDPGYAQAHALLANMYFLQWFRDMTGSDVALERAFALARKAVALDENDSTCQFMLGLMHLHRKSFDLAEQYYQRALELNPNDPEQVARMGFLYAFLGRPDEAIDWLEQAKLLDPYFSPIWYWHNLGFAHFIGHRYEAAIAALGRSSTMPFWVQAYLAACHALMDKKDQANESTDAVLRLAPDFSLTRLAAKEPFGRPADREHLCHGLRKAGLPE